MQFKEISVIATGEKNYGVVIYGLSEEGQLYAGTGVTSRPESITWKQVNHFNVVPPVDKNVLSKVLSNNESKKNKYKLS